MKSSDMIRCYVTVAVTGLCLGPPACADNIKTYVVESEHQNGVQEIRVLLPNGYRKGKAYRVLYVLPVEKGFEQRYGYGLGVLKQMNAHNRHDIIIVQMGFEKEPWYGDHATDPNTRQASYLKEFIVPFVEKRYSTIGEPKGRLLLGFSKSGWGAFSLILTYPEFFGYAASWDAPMLFDRFHYRMGQVYGTPDQLNVFRPDLLASRQKAFFRAEPRLVLTGEKDWGKSIPAPNGGSHTVEMHMLLDREGIKHVYINNLKVSHRWDEQWMAPTLEALMAIADRGGPSITFAEKAVRGEFVYYNTSLSGMGSKYPDPSSVLPASEDNYILMTLRAKPSRMLVEIKSLKGKTIDRMTFDCTIPTFSSFPARVKTQLRTAEIRQGKITVKNLAHVGVLWYTPTDCHRRTILDGES